MFILKKVSSYVLSPILCSPRFILGGFFLIISLNFKTLVHSLSKISKDLILFQSFALPDRARNIVAEACNLRNVFFSVGKSFLNQTS